MVGCGPRHRQDFLQTASACASAPHPKHSESPLSSSMSKSPYVTYHTGHASRPQIGSTPPRHVNHETDTSRTRLQLNFFRPPSHPCLVPSSERGFSPLLPQLRELLPRCSVSSRSEAYRRRLAALPAFFLPAGFRVIPQIFGSCCSADSAIGPRFPPLPPQTALHAVSRRFSLGDECT